MAQVFVPPITTGMPLAFKKNHPAYDLFKHYAPHAAGVNLWIVNGALTRTEPEVLGVNDLALLGSHITPVTAAQAAIITAAGYGAYLVGV